MSSTSPQQQQRGVSPPLPQQPPALFNLVGNQLYDEGILSVKFRVLQGRVVFFRPFVRRRTASMASSSRFVDRVIFVVHATGELVVADADALPKRSVSLRHVTTILLDSPAATVALLFESSAAEHDVQLVFGDYPPSLLKGSSSKEGSAAASMSSRNSVGGRVSFVDGGTTTASAAPAPASTGGGDDANRNQQLPPLMTPKQFVNVVLSFSPNAQVIHGAASSMELKLAKPKHFSEPASVAGEGAFLPSPIALDEAATAPSAQRTNLSRCMFDVVECGGGGDAVDEQQKQVASAGTQPSSSVSLPPKQKFREVCSTEDDNRKALLDDFSAAALTTTQVASSPSTVQQCPAGEEEEMPRSLRAIAAAGRYLSPRPRKSVEKHADGDDQDLRPPPDHPDANDDSALHSHHPEMFPPDAMPATGFDPQTALHRISTLTRKAQGTRSHEQHRDDGDDAASAASSPPLLSGMVRKLRARRGEIQMQNMMINGEVKGLQQRIQAILHSYQRHNPLPELDAFPVHQPPQRRRRGSSTSGGYDDNDYDGVLNGDGGVDSSSSIKIMTPTKQYNRALNLSLVLLSICRRQRQIHLHAEHDARVRWMAQQQQHRYHHSIAHSEYQPSGSSDGGGHQFMSADALAMMRSHYASHDAFDMQTLMMNPTVCQY